MGRRGGNNQFAVNMQNSATNVARPVLPYYYRQEEQLEPESRTVEFKKGPQFVQREIRKEVAKYICGFINSAENGRLMVGVEDSGQVRGYYANRNEVDKIRLDVDEGIKDIQPGVFPQDYSVNFVPVYDKNGSQPLPDTYVIVIYVEGSRLGGPNSDRLYETRQGAFMRRDGSIQQLSSQAIQEWTKRRHQSAIDKMKNNEASLRNEMQRKQRDFENRERQMQQREQEMEEMKRRHRDEMERASEQVRGLQAAYDVLQAENHALKNSSAGMQQDLGEIKTMLSNQGHKKSKVCVIS